MLILNYIECGCYEVHYWCLRGCFNGALLTTLLPSKVPTIFHPARIESINRLAYLDPASVVPLHIEPAAEVTFEYDEYIQKYEQWRFVEFQPMVEHSFRVELPGDWNKPQAFYFQAPNPGLLLAEISMAYSDAKEL